MRGLQLLMSSCAAIALAASAGVAYGQTGDSNRNTAGAAADGRSASGETADQAARARATSQSTEAASAAVVGEVLVTATSRETSVQHLPVAVSVFTDERRNLVGIETEADIVNFTPSMSLNGQFLSLRGVGRYTNELGTDPGVAVFVDGIYTPSPDYLNQPDFFTDRIEVLRGPQGTLGGENDIGGSVNVVEKRPTDQFHEEARAGVNNYEYWYLLGSVSGPINDKLAFRIADAFADQPSSNGFVTNLDSPIHPGSGWTNLFEGQLEWKPTDHFDAWFKVQNFTSNNAASYGVNPDEYPPFPANTPFFANCPTINGAVLQCLAPVPADLLAPTSNPEINNPYVVDVNTVGYVKLDKDWTFTTHLDWSLPWATLEYIGGYSQYDYLYLSDFDGTPSGAAGPLPAGFLSQVVTGDQWEQWFQNEVQLKSSDQGRFKWLVGAFQYWNYYHAPYNEEEPNDPGLANPTNLNGSPSIPNPQRAFYRQVAALTSQAQAIYFNLDYDLTSQVRLTGGLRYNWDEKSGRETVREVFDTAGVFFAPTLTDLDITNGGFQQQANITSSDWTGKIGAEWRPEPTTLIYLSGAKGYKSSGMALANFTPIPVVAPETLYDVEGGVKKTFGSQLLIDADVYYYDYHNLQQLLSVLDPRTGVVASKLFSAQAARTYGFELESVWSPIPDFQLTFNYSYLDARFTNFSLPGGPIIDFSQLAPGCVGTGAAGPPGTPGQCLGVAHANLNGSIIPQSPHNKVTVNPVYTAHLPFGKVTLSATYAFIDQQYYGVFNNPNFLAPSYYNLDLRLLYQPPQGHFTLVVFAHNVTSRLQIDNLTAGSFEFGPANLVRAPAAFPSRGQITYFDLGPRTVGVELQARF